MNEILIADDHPLIHKGLNNLIQDHFPGVCLHAVYNGKQVFDILIKQEFDLLILDINMPFMSFSDFEQVIQLYPKLKVLILTQYVDNHFAIRYLKKGAFGFLNKSASDEDLIAVIKSILKGNKYYSPSVMNQIVDNINGVSAEHPFEKLSSREYEIVLMITQGHSLTEIGQYMHISLSSVSTYKNRIMQKLNVKTLVSLIELANQYIK